MNILQISSLTACLAIFGTLGALPCRGTTLVNETFADGNRIDQNPPGSLLWYSAGSASTLTTVVGAMTMTANDNFVIGYVTPAGSPISLNVGEKLTLTVTFSGVLTGSLSPTGVRFGLFDSHGERVSTTGAQGSAPAYLNYAGYVATFGVNNSGNTQLASNLWKRTPGANSNLINTASGYTYATGSSTGSTFSGSIVSDNPYTLTLTLDYQSLNQLVVTSSLTGGSLSGIVMSMTDTTPVTTFDSIVLWGGANPFTSMTVSSVNLAVVPEPSATAFLGLLGLAVLAGGYLRHYRAA